MVRHVIAWGLLLLPLVARCGLVVDGVPWEPEAEAGFLTVSNFVAGNFYERKDRTAIGSGTVSLQSEAAEAEPRVFTTFAWDGVTRWWAAFDAWSEFYAWPERSGTLVTDSTYRYPVFLIELGENWTDFEIKASTNNFDAAMPGGNAGSNLVYYYRSWTADQHWSNPDPGARVFYTDDCAADPRVWREKGAGAPISAGMASSGSVVRCAVFMPTRECACGWMRRDNVKLVWSVLRVDDLGYEWNFSGTTTRWSPVVPVSWETGLKAP